MNSGLIAIAAAITMAMSTIAPGIGQGLASSKAMEAIARLMEALTIYGLLIAFMLVAKI